MVQCSACGTPIGMLDPATTPQIDAINNQIAAIDRRAAQPDCESPAGLIRPGSSSTELGVPRHVRFTPYSNRIADIAGGLFRATSGLIHRRRQRFFHFVGADEQRWWHGQAEWTAFRLGAYRPTSLVFQFLCKMITSCRFGDSR